MNDMQGGLDAVAALFNVADVPLPAPLPAVAVAVPGPRLAARRGFPSAALPQSGRIASGTGLTREKARLSALGEAVELASTCAWGNEPALVASEASLGDAALPLRALLGFSDRQYDERDSWNAACSGFDRRPLPPDRRQRRRWLVVENLVTAEKRYAPEVFILTSDGPPGTVAADSNGCACGDTIGQATLAALLELIERDATGRWWYGMRPAPGIDWRALPLSEPLRALLAGRARITRLADITSDIAVPVVAAVSAEPDGRDVAVGFAARPSTAAAAKSAIDEMLQQEIPLAQSRLLPAAAPLWSHWREAVTLAVPPLSRIGEAERCTAMRGLEASATAALDACIAACAARGVDLWRIDLTRPAFGVPVVRVLSTTLCHCRPRFARPRLLAGAATTQPNPLVLTI